MKLSIKHLLLYRWEGPSIGIRVKTSLQTYGAIIPIPVFLSNLLIYLKRHKKGNPNDFTIGRKEK
jgi:hypothetical protein